MGVGRAGRKEAAEGGDESAWTQRRWRPTALRSIVRRDTGERYEEFLTRLAKESGIETPTRKQLAKLDRKRPKKGSNDD